MYSLNDIKHRPLKTSDLEMVLNWRNSKKVRQMMVDTHVIKPSEHKEWFLKVDKDDCCEWLIVEFQNKSIGVVYITDINLIHGTCSWGMYIDESMHNSGIGVLIEFLAIERMVNEFSIRKICGQYLPSNKKIFALHKKFGFVEEGVLKEHLFRNGKFEDLIFIALFANKWIKIREDLISMLGFKL